MNKWKIAFLILITFLIAYRLGVESTKTDLWFYMGPDTLKGDTALIQIITN